MYPGVLRECAGIFGAITVMLSGSDNGYIKQQTAEKARLENWWRRYHEADAETRRLMACGAIV